MLPRVPVPLTSFVGRAQEVAEVRHLLGSVGSLTLVGAAGIGKSRLVLEAARDTEDEVAFVELAPLADEALQSRCLMLVLDNCEQLLPPMCGLRPPGDVWPGSGDHEQRCRAYRCGFGVNGWPSASDTGTKMAVAGDEHGLVRGSSVSVGDSAQLPDAMSLFVCTATTVSRVVS